MSTNFKNYLWIQIIQSFNQSMVRLQNFDLGESDLFLSLLSEAESIMEPIIENGNAEPPNKQRMEDFNKILFSLRMGSNDFIDEMIAVHGEITCYMVINATIDGVNINPII